MLSFQMVPTELVPWSLQPVYSSSSSVCILSKCVGRPTSCLSVSLSAPTCSVLFEQSSLLSFCRALQDVQIRFQPQLNPDVIAPLPTHTPHEEFGK